MKTKCWLVITIMNYWLWLTMTMPLVLLSIPTIPHYDCFCLIPIHMFFWYIYIYIKHIHMTPSHMKYDRLRINILYCSNNILPILQVSNYPRYSGWILLIHSSEHRWNLRPAMISYGDDFPDPIPIISVTSRPDVILPSGKHTKSYWTWPFIVDLPIENGDVP